MFSQGLLLCIFAVVSSSVVYRDAYGNLVRYEGRSDELNVYRRKSNSPYADSRRYLPAARDVLDEGYPAFETFHDRRRPSYDGLPKRSSVYVGKPLEKKKKDEGLPKKSIVILGKPEEGEKKKKDETPASGAALKDNKPKIIVENKPESKDSLPKKISQDDLDKLEEDAKKAMEALDAAKKRAASSKKEVFKKPSKTKDYKYDNLFGEDEPINLPVKKDASKLAKVAPIPVKDAPKPTKDAPKPTPKPAKDAPKPTRQDAPKPTRQDAYENYVQDFKGRRNDAFKNALRGLSNSRGRGRGDAARRSFGRGDAYQRGDASRRSFGRGDAYQRGDASRRSFGRGDAYQRGDASRRSFGRGDAYQKGDASRRSFGRRDAYQRGDASRRSFSTGTGRGDALFRRPPPPGDMNQQHNKGAYHI